MSYSDCYDAVIHNISHSLLYKQRFIYNYKTNTHIKTRYKHGDVRFLNGMFKKNTNYGQTCIR